MNKQKLLSVYVAADFVAAIGSWTLFFYARKEFIDPYKFKFKDIFVDINYFYGLVILPILWVLLYYIAGHYQNVYRRSRLKDVFQTLYLTVVGSLVLFFSILLDDNIVNYSAYYKSLFLLIAIHFSFTILPRYIVATRIKTLIKKRKMGFPTLLIGSNEKAEQLYSRLNNKKSYSGNSFIGFVNVFTQEEYVMKKFMPHLGNIADIKKVLKKHNVTEIIIAIESSEHKYIENILYKIEGVKAEIYAIPDNCDIISGRVRITSLDAEPLIHISHRTMPSWQEKLKRIIDIVTSIFVLLAFSPLYAFVALGVKMSSPGPIFYRQIRIGRNGMPFRIYKFRSMYKGSEQKGYALASKNDNRTTRFGAFIRKVRLDEIPQFFNVLIGDMSLVGPRPERQHYINKILKKAPQYTRLLRVRPGITSWGQVKYGYAKNVDEMVERLKYDLIYIENMSILVDVKILLYTIKTVVLGKGL